MKIERKRKPRFIDVFRIILGIAIIIVSFFADFGYIPDARASAGIGLLIFGLLFILWGLYPMYSKHEPSSSKVMRVMDKLSEYPETPGTLKKVRIPGTNIVAGYSKEELAAMEAAKNKTEPPQSDEEEK